MHVKPLALSLGCSNCSINEKALQKLQQQPQVCSSKTWTRSCFYYKVPYVQNIMIMGQWLLKLFQRMGHLVIIIHILCCALFPYLIRIQFLPISLLQHLLSGLQRTSNLVSLVVSSSHSGLMKCKADLITPLIKIPHSLEWPTALQDLGPAYPSKLISSRQCSPHPLKHKHWLSGKFSFYLKSSIILSFLNKCLQ